MALNGNGVTIKIGTHGVAGINNIAFDTALDQLDVTDFDSNGNKEYIAGLSGGTIALSGDYEPTDTNGQVAIQTAFTTKALMTGATKPVFTVNGTNGFTADALVSVLSISMTPEGKVTISFTLQLTGAISIVPA